MMPDLIDAIMSAGMQLAKSSWEFAAATEALLELYDPDLSIFGKHPFEAAENLQLGGAGVAGLAYVESFIEVNGSILVDGDGSSGDTASLGVYAAMLGLKDATYQKAVEREIDYLLKDTPRWKNGAISHRSEYAELWADFIFMAPPFLAYQAILTDNGELLNTAIQQCILYADVLKTGNLWKHIIGPQWLPSRDTGLWATGNGWVAAGLVRVIATALHAKPVPRDQIAKLAELTSSLLDGAITSATNGSPPLLCNYLDDPTYFGDVAGTALIAASAFRLAQLTPDTSNKGHIEWAEQSWSKIEKVITDRHGDVGPTPMPGVACSRTPSIPGSSQGHSFVVMCFAARRDWLQRQDSVDRYHT